MKFLLALLYLVGTACSQKLDTFASPEHQGIVQVMDKYFGETRHYISGRNALNEAKNLIFTHMQNTGLEANEINFPTATSGGNPIEFDGTLLEGIKKGQFYGTHKDRILLIGADYDTDMQENNALVDSTGIMAFIQLLDLFKLQTCKHKYTTIFLASTMRPSYVGKDKEGKHYYSGGEYYLQEILLPSLEKSNATFLGYYFMDSVGNFNNKQNSQKIPDSFSQAFPEATDKIVQNEKKGNFLSIVSRHNTADQGLYESFAEIWGSYKSPLYHMPMTQKHFVEEFLAQQHKAFWVAGSSIKRNMTSVLITDTGLLREPSTCTTIHCKPSEMMTEENILFLLKTSETLNHLVKNAQCGACSNTISKFSAVLLIIVSVRSLFSL